MNKIKHTYMYYWCLVFVPVSDAMLHQEAVSALVYLHLSQHDCVAAPQVEIVSCQYPSQAQLWPGTTHRAWVCSALLLTQIWPSSFSLRYNSSVSESLTESEFIQLLTQLFPRNRTLNDSDMQQTVSHCGSHLYWFLSTFNYCKIKQALVPPPVIN